MALLNSKSIELGSPLPSFSLASVDSKKYSQESFKGKDVLVILFICNHCPYVKAIEDRILNLHRYFEKQSVQFVGICSNDSTDYPDDAPDQLKERWKKKQYRFPYLLDIEQTAARDFGAVCTPDIFVYDRSHKLAYHGRLDDNWQDPKGVKTHDLRDAIEALLRSHVPVKHQTPSMGCSIKWKK